MHDRIVNSRLLVSGRSDIVKTPDVRARMSFQDGIKALRTIVAANGEQDILKAAQRFPEVLEVVALGFLRSSDRAGEVTDEMYGIPRSPMHVRVFSNVGDFSNVSLLVNYPREGYFGKSMYRDEDLLVNSPSLISITAGKGGGDDGYVSFSYRAEEITPEDNVNGFQTIFATMDNHVRTVHHSESLQQTKAEDTSGYTLHDPMRHLTDSVQRVSEALIAILDSDVHKGIVEGSIDI